MTGLSRIISGWLCEDIADLRQQLANARLDLDDAFDAQMELSQSLGIAKADLGRLQLAMTPEGADALALSVTAQIADIYAASHATVARRNDAVKRVILAAIKQATTGAAK